jgi:hypothetical protein
MSLDLFVNYERTSNSSLFYREISADPYTFILRLQDTNNPDVFLTDGYIAEYITSSDSNRVLFDNELTATIKLTATTPCVHTISVTAYNDTNINLYEVLSMSAVFVSSFPTAKFVSYPKVFLSPTAPVYRASINTSLYFSETAYLTALSSQNIGNAFYGEGRVETIALSTNTLYVNCSARWGIGQYSTNTNTVTTNILIPSSPNEFVIYPTSLQLYNQTFSINGPIIRYNDTSGVKSFYPFYASSINPDGTEKLPNDTFARSLSVLKYPIPTSVGYNFISPFNSSSINLPSDSSERVFSSTLTFPASPPSNIFLRTPQGSKWQIEATANPSGINPDWSFTTKNPIPPSTPNFRFDLSYYDENNIDGAILKSSVGYPTTINVNVSAIERTSVPVDTIYGWQDRNQYIEFNATVLVNPLPVTNLYVPNYYNLTGTDVSFTNIWSNDDSDVLTPAQTVVSYNGLSSILSGSEVGSLYFGQNNIGLIDLSATTTFLDVDNNETTKDYSFPNIFEVVTTYDDIETNHYHTNLSPLVITRNILPRISPNEWVTSDNVNSIIDKISLAIAELDEYSSLYKETNKTTGRLNQQYVEASSTTELLLSSYNIQDGSIVTFLNNQIYTLSSLQTTVSEASSLITFGANLTADPITVNYFSRVPIDSPAGYEYVWSTPSIDPNNFYNWPVPSLSSSIYYTGVVSLPSSNQLVVGYKNSINLIDNTYKTRVLGTEISIDQIFKFENIKAIGVTSKDYIVVLDSDIPRVSIYTISNNKFNLLTTWGRFGYTQSKQGFNAPQDLHIDSNDLVWIADTNNSCIKKFTINGKHLLTITHDTLNIYAPISVCIDSQQNVHALTNNGVFVFNSEGVYIFQYSLPDTVQGVVKINTSYNREVIYITYLNGVIKYFRNGTIYQYIVDSQVLVDKSILTGYNSIFQDQFRNLYISVKDQIIRVADIMKLQRYRSQSLESMMWTSDELYVHDEEYVQPWVYLRSFHRLWDNIELFRGSLFYNELGRRIYTGPTYKKEDLIIGQNELVTNSVINRLCDQLWTNLRSIINYFDPNYVNVRATPTITPIPTPTPTPTPTLTPTPTPTPTITPTPTPTPTPSVPDDGIVQIIDPSTYFISASGSYLIHS